MSEWPTEEGLAARHVQAFDARTGKLKWVFHVIPENGEFGADTWKDGSNSYTGNASLETGSMSGDAMSSGRCICPFSRQRGDLGRISQGRWALCPTALLR